MGLTNAQHCKIKRQKKIASKKKEIRGIYANEPNHDEIKKLTSEYVESLNNQFSKQIKGE